MVLGCRGAGLVMFVPGVETQTPRVFKNPWGLAGSYASMMAISLAVGP